MSNPIPIVIPSYQKPEQLAECLECIEFQTIPCRVIIEDNNTVNRGYTKAVNDGLRKVTEPYAIVLNQDAYLMVDAVEQMVRFMDAHPRCAIGGIKQLWHHNPDIIYHGGGADILPFGIHHQGFQCRGDCAESRQMGWVNGACMIVRMAALPDIGLMDENMVLFGSDADWCITAVNRGWECWYIAEAVCHHVVGVSAGQPPALAQQCCDDMAYFTRKLVEQFQPMFVPSVE